MGRLVVVTALLASVSLLPRVGLAAASLTLETTAGKASVWCSDPEFPDDCSCPTTATAEVDPGEDVASCYRVTNSGTVVLTTHTLVDASLGTILSNFPFSLGAGASAFVTQRFGASLSPGTYPVGATWTAGFDGSGSVADTDAYAYVIVEPSLVMQVTIAPALDVCGDPDDAGTCVLPVTNAAAYQPGVKMAIGFEVSNNGPTTFALHDLVDDGFGSILSDFPFSLAPASSAYLVELETPSAPFERSATWSGTTAGGFVSTSMDSYTLFGDAVFADGFE